MKKPKMILNMRISIDSAHKQRFTEDEVLKEFSNHNIRIDRTLVIRKHDGAVLGEILTDVQKEEIIIITKKELQTFHNDVSGNQTGWSDSSYRLVKFLGIDPTEGI